MLSRILLQRFVITLVSVLSLSACLGPTGVPKSVDDPMPFTAIPADSVPETNSAEVLSRESIIQNTSTGLEAVASLTPQGFLLLTENIGEFGSLKLRQSSRNSFFSHSFEKPMFNPVVFMQPLSFNAGDQAVIRLRNVTQTGFQFQIDEWDYLNGAHATEIVSYLVLEQGVWTNGSFFEAGTIDTNQTFSEVDLGILNFFDDPIILTQVQTRNASTAITTRQQRTPTGFEVKVQEEEAADGIHNTETIGYLALSPGLSFFGEMALFAGQTANNMTQNFRTINPDFPTQGLFSPNVLASMQTTNDDDTAALRYRLNQDDVQIRVEEEQSLDLETLHNNETVGFVIMQNLADETKLLAFDGAANDSFGDAVAVDGDTLVIGSPRDDDNGPESGSAYVFERDILEPTGWRLVKKLIASDAAAVDSFGEAVAIHEDTIVVGSSFNDDNGGSSGSAYVFDRNLGGTNNWGQRRKLLASDAAALDLFGDAVAIHEDSIIVGAFGNDDNGDRSGSAYVFDRNLGGANNWGQQRKLLASDGAASDFFGFAVAIDGDTIVIGASENDETAVGAGAAYVFERNLGGTNNWGEQVKLLASDGAASDSFGEAVAIDGDTIMIGASENDETAVGVGAAYVFERHLDGTNAWGEQVKLLASDGTAGDDFGEAVAISGDRILIGADNKSIARGAAYVFERNNGGINTWGEQSILTASDGQNFDFFGNAVAIRPLAKV